MATKTIFLDKDGNVVATRERRFDIITGTTVNAVKAYVEEDGVRTSPEWEIHTTCHACGSKLRRLESARMDYSDARVRQDDIHDKPFEQPKH